MKRAIAGLVLLLCFASAPSVSALGCYTCVPNGYVCGIFGCEYTYQCNPTSSFCSHNCWESCSDNQLGYCHVSYQCQWAAVSEDEDVFSTETLRLITFPAP